MFAEIIFPLPFRKVFTYSVPGEFEKFVKPGIRVIVPFGKRVLTGFLIKVKDQPEIEDEIKPISDIIDEKPIFNAKDLEFYNWISEYYLCSLGEALKLAIPYGTEIESKRKIIPHKEICQELLEKEKSTSRKNWTKRKRVLRVLLEKDELSLSYVQKRSGLKNIYNLIKSLEDEGALTVLTTIPDAKVKVKKINYVKIEKSAVEIYETIPEIESRSPKQVAILLQLISNKGKSLALSDLLKKTNSSKSSVDSLEKKGLVKIFEKEVERKYVDEYLEEHIKFELTDAQTKIINELSSYVNDGKFKTFLLHGVTGSGKTQVYIELTKIALKKNKSVLILVPEISLTPQITSRLYNNFGEQVTVIHSRMSLGERYDSWRRVLSGKSKIVIGARSALFSPLINLGLIVVDEEHDTSYKQFESVPKYNAKDSAVVLGKINSCPVILGSATPSIESMYNAQTGKYKLLELKERVDNAKLPQIELVNISSQQKKKSSNNAFSKLLLNKIEDRLNKKESVIILQNRRGFSTHAHCVDCGEVITCDNCSVPLVYHINKNYLQCHYCGLTREVPQTCPNCGSFNLRFFGTGTEKVEDEIEFYFPKARIKRIDSDSITKKSSLGKTLLQFRKGEIDILVGTQMVSKGLDFSSVTLVGVISAETTLWLPDFRADERTFQLLTQVAGRAGRSKVAGEVVIQTQNENNFTLQRVLTNDYNGFYSKEINNREKMLYPPFSRLCLIESKDLNQRKAETAIFDFYKELKKFNKRLTILSPTMAVVSRIKGYYRFHILIKSNKKSDPNGTILRKALWDSIANYNRKAKFKDVKLSFDVDPQNLM